MEILKYWSVPRNGGGTRSRCLAKCSCGNVGEYDKNNVTRGNTTRCNDCALKSRAEKRKTHGCSMSFKDRNPEKYATYTVWQAIKRRCKSKKDKRYNDYGGRGIKVCDRWDGSFDLFIEDMGFRPSNNHQIDRIDNDGDYSPENCRWITSVENARNKRKNRILCVDGEEKCLAEWAEISNVNAATIARRVGLGWSHKDAVFGNRHKRVYTTPKGKFKTLADVQKAYSMSSSGVHSRFKSNSFPDWLIEDI